MLDNNENRDNKFHLLDSKMSQVLHALFRWFGMNYQVNYKIPRNNLSLNSPTSLLLVLNAVFGCTSNCVTLDI